MEHSVFVSWNQEKLNYTLSIKFQSHEPVNKIGEKQQQLLFSIRILMLELLQYIFKVRTFALY